MSKAIVELGTGPGCYRTTAPAPIKPRTASMGGMDVALALAFLLVSSSADTKKPETVRATLPGKAVDVSVDLEDFHSGGPVRDPAKTILHGTIRDRVVYVSFLWDEGKD